MAIHSLTGIDPISGEVATVSREYNDNLAALVIEMLVAKYNWTPTVPDPLWQAEVDDPGNPGLIIPNPEPQGTILNPKRIGMLFIEDAEIYWTGQLRNYAKQKDEAIVPNTNQLVAETLISTISS